MEQKYKIIKETKQFFFDQIKAANEGLEEIREKCDHPEKHIEICNYMWAPGHISPNTKICGICGEVIPESYIIENNQAVWTGEGEFPHPEQ